MNNLYVVATPIGNLEDITFRAVRILKEVDVILCEDTRHTKILLARYQIDKSLISYHQHSKISKVDKIISLLKEGKNLALVSDAGTPALSDPGGMLIEKVLMELKDQANIVPIPGASALTAIISVAGIPTDKFEWLGFLPHKKGRQTIFKQIDESKKTMIFYESVHRIEKTLIALEEVLKNERRVVIGRELTKKFESIYRGSITEVKKDLENDEIKGELVIIVEGNK